MFSFLATTTALSNTLLNLMFYPEAQREILAEVQQVLDNRSFQDLRQADLIELKKLDSFIKETQRLAPPSSLAVTREIIAPDGFTLSNGLHLPQGSYGAVAAKAIMHDPDIWGDPDKFDAMRFYKLRQRPGHNNMHQFVGQSDLDVNFGAENQACPGRFLVSYELKILVAYLLLNYDMKLADDSKTAIGSDTLGAKPNLKIGFRKKQIRLN
ncbi:uncharacterized protein Z518_08252 [Rhinocladiella mackenziei CBS 650.93]|uniref:Cytochrome P450 monooxygenase n=1 Tax=Rhinocladiella mackenziei CBS 650.93 TaxID=1442369 RepID=A0A0D2IGB1_9EURO|nr:uncharacterized protein Z518_08252 [Rhinocladiella mackenziei CBS 650.93]KIX02311.1 hypothetical protein Z518_08252 [Rhinocladiella mackenziei CBS 650.93]